MAQLLKSGATMLERSCPRCKVPLFKLKGGEIVCPSCGQRYVIVSSDEEELEVYGNMVIQELEKVAIGKLAEISSLLRQARNLEEVHELLPIVLNLLRTVSFTRKVRERRGETGKS
ncbi:MAG TPA: hypothetical protein ENF80_05305 [Thermofilum sp.]|nr:hypothetical protein [Thermofilum sp.]